MDINRVEQSQSLDAALAIGRLVVEAFSRIGKDDEEGALLSGGGLLSSSPSYRLLARHPSLNISHSRLWQMVQIYLQHDALPPRARTLPYSHQRALLSAPTDGTRSKLAVSAVEQQWTVKELQRRVAEVRRPSAGGRKPTATALRARDRLHDALAFLTPGDLDVVFRGLNGGEVADLLEDLAGALAAMERRLHEIRGAVRRSSW